MIIICLYFAAVVAIRPFIDTRNLLQELLFTFIHFLIFSLCLAYLDEPWGHSDAVAVINILFTVLLFFFLRGKRRVLFTVLANERKLAMVFSCIACFVVLSVEISKEHDNDIGYDKL